MVLGSLLQPVITRRDKQRGDYLTGPGKANGLLGLIPGPQLPREADAPGASHVLAGKGFW